MSASPNLQRDFVPRASASDPDPRHTVVGIEPSGSAAKPDPRHTALGVEPTSSAAKPNPHWAVVGIEPSGSAAHADTSTTQERDSPNEDQNLGGGWHPYFPKLEDSLLEEIHL